jgi:cytochrome P450
MRKAARDANLAGTAVRAGDSVLLWTQAAMLDAKAFSDPQTLRPDRPDASYLHFGGGLHPCAGRGVNAWQIPMLVVGLLDRRPTKLGPMIWAGPFPAQLPIHLEGRP